jgi:hypothetical protein
VVLLAPTGTDSVRLLPNLRHVRGWFSEIEIAHSLRSDKSCFHTMEECARSGRGRTRKGLTGKVLRQVARVSAVVLPLVHLLPCRFENVTFAIGKALDAVSRDFLEDGVHLFAEEFRRG